MRNKLPIILFRQTNRVLCTQSVLISAILFGLQLLSSMFTGSLLLFSLALLQLAFTSLLFSFSLDYQMETPRDFHLAVNLLSFFLLWLLTGYIFSEAADRWSVPGNIFSPMATLTGLMAASGNVFILYLIKTITVSPQRQPDILLFGAILTVALIGSIAIHIFIYFSGFSFLDTLSSCLLGILIFIWAGFSTLDQYWYIFGIGNPQRPS